MKFQKTLFTLLCVTIIACNKPLVDETKHLEISNQTLTLETAGTKDSFTIESNVNWQITTSANWFSISEKSGNNNSAIFITAIQNNASGNTRSDTITVTPEGVSGLQPSKIIVRQSYEKLSTQWTKLYGGSINDTVYYMTKANDVGFVLVGNSQSNDGDLATGYGDQDAWLIKLDGNGAKQWSKKFGGSGFDNAMSVTASGDNGFVLSGRTASKNGDAAGNHGGFDYFILKVDASGNKQWSKVFGGSADEIARCVIATTDGGYIVAGDTESTDGDLMNLGKGAWIIKLDANGNKQWSRTYGGIGGEEIWSIITSPAGGYVAAGAINAGGNKNAWIFKIDGNGNQQWSKTYGGNRLDLAWSLVSTTNGGYVFSGGTYSSDGDLITNYGNMDAWVVKLDANGNKVWSKVFGGLSDDLGDNIIATSDGGVLLASSTRSINGDAVGNANLGSTDALVIKLSSDGNKQWSKIYGGLLDDFVECVAATSDGFAIAGLTASKNGMMKDNHGKTDGFLIKEKVQ